MSVTGKVINGAVVLPSGTKLPEGAEVKIETIATDDSFLEAVERLAKPRFQRADGLGLSRGYEYGALH